MLTFAPARLSTSSPNVAAIGRAWGDRGLGRIFHTNQCAYVCPAIVETVATIDYFNKAIFMFAVILSSRYELNPACSMKRMPKPTITMRPTGPSRAFSSYPVPNSYDLDSPMTFCAG